MGIGVLVLGVAVVVLVAVDLIFTAMGQGGGPLTRVVTTGLWKVAKVFYRVVPSRRLLSHAGIGVVLFSALSWILLLWVGWTLIFSVEPQAVVHTKTGLPASAWERVYFTGFTLFTLGTGDFHAVGDRWLVLMAVASINGLFLVTFSITYLVPVVQAATHRRQVGVYLSTLGLTPQEILCNAWDGEKLSGLENQLGTIAQQLALIQQRHMTYPVLHYLHSRRRVEAIAVGVAALDEALSILKFGIEEGEGLHPLAFLPVRRAISELLDTLGEAFIEPAPEPPPIPSLERLREAGLPVCDEREFNQRMQAVADRRRLLLGFVRNDGWDWDRLSIPSVAAAEAAWT